MKKILYVEDDESVRELMKLMLSSYDAKFAEEGNEALQYLDANSFDLIITDINMPNGMGGIELIKKCNERKIQTPIVVVSGYLNNEETVKSLNTFTNITYLEKPVEFKELLAIINK